MEIYTYSEARQKLSSVLDKAEASGKVLIRRRDGRMYSVVPARPRSSPLDLPSIKSEITTDEIVSIVREERGRNRGAKDG